MLMHGAQVRLCRERTTGNIFAMKKLRKDEMLRRGQACPASWHVKHARGSHALQYMHLLHARSQTSC